MRNNVACCIRLRYLRENNHVSLVNLSARTIDISISDRA